MSLKAVVFDMDGVVVDSTHAWWLTFNQALEHFDLPTVSEGKFMDEILGESTEDDIELYYPGVSEEELLSSYDSFFRGNLSEVRAFPDTLPLLEFLSIKDLKTAIATNTPRKLAGQTLGQAGLTGRFDFVFTADDVENGKPDPAMILFACEKMIVGVDEILYVGDTKADVSAAKAAGCRMVGVGICGDVQIQRLRELIPIISEMLD
ncbi:MAG: HAD family hydrolase [Methanobacteriota archaeon]